jgi:predicted TIM-barrel fold metal-dependent hydrolase
MADLGFKAFDADQHYYEAEDAFIRHIDPKFAKRAMQWAEINGRKRLLVGGQVNRFIPNPTFDPCAKPGVLDDYFRGKTSVTDMREAFGELDPIHPGYRDRDVRVSMLDEQGVEACFVFPTLGVGMEMALKHDPEAACAAFRAFNRYIAEDWGFSYQDRLFTAAAIPLIDPDWAVEELQWAIDNDVRIIQLRPGPIMTPTGNYPLGHPRNDPFFQLVNDAGITICCHSGDAGYGFFQEQWGIGGEFEAFRQNTLGRVLSAEPVADGIASFIAGGVFARFPNIRVATIESGSTWVTGLLRRLTKAYKQVAHEFAEDPVETFRRHVWVAPYYEDDLAELRDQIGAEHILFGSDFPHAEGLAVPTDFVHDLEGFSDEEIRLIMRENASGLSKRQVPANA